MENNILGIPITPDTLHFGNFAKDRTKFTFIYTKSGKIFFTESYDKVHGHLIKSDKIVPILKELNQNWVTSAKKIGYNTPEEVYDLLNYNFDSLNSDDIKFLKSLGISIDKLKELSTFRLRLQSTGKLLFGRSAVIPNDSTKKPSLVFSLWATPNVQLIEKFRTDTKIIDFFQKKYWNIPKQDWFITVKNDYSYEKENVSEYKFFSNIKIDDKIGEFERLKKDGAEKLLQYLQKKKGLAPKTEKSPDEKKDLPQTEKKYNLSFGTFTKVELQQLRNDVHVGSAEKRKNAISILCKINEKDLKEYPELDGYIPPGCDKDVLSVPNNPTWGKISRDLSTKQNPYSHITASESFSFKNFLLDS
jgi:hypothetical protein